MREWLINRNIGWDFTKQKSLIPRMKKDKLEKLYRASVLTNNLGDISKLRYDEMPDFDLFNFSFPCTDISIAGKQKGLKNDDGSHTRSGLVKFGLEVIKAKKPKYIMIENVKALIQKKFINDFYSIVEEIEDIGYKCYYPTKEDKKGNKVPICLNAKDFGVPQNRERIFVICIRNDVDSGYEFPQGFPLEIRLKDVLEDSVDSKYYLSEEIQNRFVQNHKDNGIHNIIGTTKPECRSIGQRDNVYGQESVMGALVATDYKQPKQIIENGAIRGRYNGEGKVEQELELRSDGVSNTITTVQKDNILIENGQVKRIGGCFDKEGQTHQAGSIYDTNELSPTLDTMQGGYRQPCIQVVGKLECEGWYDIESRVNSTEGIGATIECRNRAKYMITENNNNDICIDDTQGFDGVRTYNGTTPTLRSQRNGLKTIDKNFKIRKLTPLECWRLMSFTDEEFEKAKSTGCSDSQLYKQAGNSIVVDVLYYIFKNLFK